MHFIHRCWFGQVGTCRERSKCYWAPNPIWAFCAFSRLWLTGLLRKKLLSQSDGLVIITCFCNTLPVHRPHTAIYSFICCNCWLAVCSRKRFLSDLEPLMCTSENVLLIYSRIEFSGLHSSLTSVRKNCDSICALWSTLPVRSLWMIIPRMTTRYTQENTPPPCNRLVRSRRRLSQFQHASFWPVVYQEGGISHSVS